MKCPALCRWKAGWSTTKACGGWRYVRNMISLLLFSSNRHPIFRRVLVVKVPGIHQRTVLTFDKSGKWYSTSSLHSSAKFLRHITSNMESFSQQNIAVGIARVTLVPCTRGWFFGPGPEEMTRNSGAIATEERWLTTLRGCFHLEGDR